MKYKNTKHQRNNHLHKPANRTASVACDECWAFNYPLEVSAIVQKNVNDIHLPRSSLHSFRAINLWLMVSSSSCQRKIPFRIQMQEAFHHQSVAFAFCCIFTLFLLRIWWFISLETQLCCMPPHLLLMKGITLG